MRWLEMSAALLIVAVPLADRAKAQKASDIQTQDGAAAGSASLDPSTCARVDQSAVWRGACHQAQARVAVPPSVSSQWHDAMTRHSATLSDLAFGQYSDDATSCMQGATQASAILQFERQYAANEKPEVAARAASNAMGYPDVAAIATTVPSTMSPDEFSRRIMKACLTRLDR